jgi:hypothetical protein
LFLEVVSPGTRGLEMGATRRLTAVRVIAAPLGYPLPTSTAREKFVNTLLIISVDTSDCDRPQMDISVRQSVR